MIASNWCYGLQWKIVLLLFIFSYTKSIWVKVSGDMEHLDRRIQGVTFQINIYASHISVIIKNKYMRIKIEVL